MTVPQGRTPIEPRDTALTCARIADGKKARDIVVLDIRRLFFLTDFFVIATGNNTIQLRAIADEVNRRLKEAGLRRLSLTGYQDGRWVLMDYIDVVVHLFLPEAREYYDLELLWGDAPRLDWEAGSIQMPPSVVDENNPSS